MSSDEHSGGWMDAEHLGARYGLCPDTLRWLVEERRVMAHAFPDGRGASSRWIYYEPDLACIMDREGDRLREIDAAYRLGGRSAVAKVREMLTIDLPPCPWCGEPQDLIGMTALTSRVGYGTWRGCRDEACRRQKGVRMAVMILREDVTGLLDLNEFSSMLHQAASGRRATMRLDELHLPG